MDTELLWLLHASEIEPAETSPVRQFVGKASGEPDTARSLSKVGLTKNGSLSRRGQAIAASLLTPQSLLETASAACVEMPVVSCCQWNGVWTVLLREPYNGIVNIQYPVGQANIREAAVAHFGEPPSPFEAFSISLTVPEVAVFELSHFVIEQRVRELERPLQKEELLKQLGLAIGIPFGLISLVIVLISGRSLDTVYALGLIAALLILTWLFIMAVYRGKYEAEFALDQKGVLCRTQAGQAKKNRIVNTLAVIFGLLSGGPAAAGAGMLAQSRQEVFIRWKRITKVKYKPHTRTILLRGEWTEQIALFCTDENYPVAEEFINGKTKIEGSEKQ